MESFFNCLFRFRPGSITSEKIDGVHVAWPCDAHAQGMSGGQGLIHVVGNEESARDITVFACSGKRNERWDGGHMHTQKRRKRYTGISMEAEMIAALILTEKNEHKNTG